MTAKEFKEKAEKLLSEYEAGDDYSFTWQRGSEILDEFIHLVYFFDSNLPMLKEILSDDPKIPHSNQSYYHNPKIYMKRFIHYLEDYVIADKSDK